MAYGFFIVATRHLGARDAAPIAVLWTVWAIATAVLSFPIQHWIVRTVEAGAETEMRSALPRVWSGVGVLALVAVAGTWIAGDDLYGSRSLTFPAFCGVAIFGAALIGIVRGGLAAREGYVAVSWTLAGENGVRMLGAVPAVLAGAGPGWFGLILVSGAFVGLVWPHAWVFRSEADVDHRPALRMLTDFAGGSLVSQVVLTGAPIGLALVGGAPSDVTALFAALALFRAPHVVAIGLVTQITGGLTRLAVAGDIPRLRRVVGGTTVGTVLTAAAFGAGGHVVGADILSMVFGPAVRLQPNAMALVGVATGFALGGLVLTLMLLARGATTVLLWSWLAGLSVGSAWLAAGAGTPVLRAAGAFAVAEVVAWTAMLWSELRWPYAGSLREGRPEDVDDPLGFRS